MGESTAGSADAFERARAGEVPAYVLPPIIRAYRDQKRFAEAERWALEGQRRYPMDSTWPTLLGLLIRSWLCGIAVRRPLRNSARLRTGAPLAAKEPRGRRCDSRSAFGTRSAFCCRLAAAASATPSLPSSRGFSLSRCSGMSFTYCRITLATQSSRCPKRTR
jgi:hypothetical protein